MDVPAPADPFGTHRVVAPPGTLPQAAEIVDASPTRREEGEVHLDVETLNVDSASMRQLLEEQGGDPDAVGRRIEEIVRGRGKLVNPVTGSGGMLLGRVSWVGSSTFDRTVPSRAAATAGVSVGDRVATLVSLTLTPLTLRRILAVDPATHQVDVEGTAVVFESGSIVRMPDDLPTRLALALFDVAGAVPQVARHARPGGAVLVLGAGGKSGLLVAAAARRAVGDGGFVCGIERDPAGAHTARRLGHCHAVLEGDAADPVATRRAAIAVAPGLVRAADGYDLVVSCVNAPCAEMAAILCCRTRGTVYFFSMATSFARAALGAEGVSRDVDMLVGNGYAEGHAEATLALVRAEPGLEAELGRRYA